MLNRRQLIASGTGLLIAGSLSRTHAQEASELQINSARYISINADTGAIFAQRGANDQVAIASLTKVFTAMEAISIAPLDTQIITTSDDMQPADATTMGFGPGEAFTLEELIYGMLLPSGNDAAHAISRSLGYQEGDSADEATQRFMDLVNQRVLAMGLNNTHLLNPDGWGVPGHYSSAADVAAFLAYASKSSFLMKVMGTSRYTTSAGYQLVNTNKVLASSPSVIGGKTGYDWDSGWCLVQMAQRQNTRVIAVTLDGIAPDDWYNDNLVLLDYGFDQQSRLGSNQFDGEFVAWQDPTPSLFAQAGAAEASITGETENNEVVITREETARVPQRIVPEAEPEPIHFEGRAGSGRVAGIGAGILAGAMAAIRWVDFGGDRTSATISPSIDAAVTSLKSTIPPLPSFRRQDTNPEVIDPAAEELEDDSDAQPPHDDDEKASTFSAT